MDVVLREMTGDEIAAFVRRSVDDYVAERAEVGDEPAHARRVAEAQIAASFPDGHPAPGHLLFCVEAGDEPVGTVWLGPTDGGSADQWWLWEITIDDRVRGQGIGRRAMVLAESVARDRGATELGLNVFGRNTGARDLYESLGYEPVAIRMRKLL